MGEGRTGRQVAEDISVMYGKMFDLNITREKMMGMMPGMLRFMSRRPDRVQPILEAMLPMMRSIGVEPGPDLLVEMMPYVVQVLDEEPSLGRRIFRLFPTMLGAFGLKMSLPVMAKVMPSMMGLMLRHPRLIPPMMLAMPKMM